MPDIRPAFTHKDTEIPFISPVKLDFSPASSNNSVATTPPELVRGVGSLFNPYAVVAFPSMGILSKGATSNAMLDTNASKFFPKTSEKYPSIFNLCKDLELGKKEPYGYTDFLYCKYVGKIPNTQLITLRRYPAPTFDNLATPSKLIGEPNERSISGSGYVSRKEGTIEIEEQPYNRPLATAVTWFGDETENKLSDILSFSVNFNWKNVEAEVNSVSGNEQGSEDSPLPGAAKFLGMLTGQVNAPWATANSQYDPYNNGPYAHRVYGPVNVISKTYKRDRGLDFKQTMTINFHYSLKSIGKINPKAAMLDLMGNMLTMTYNNAAFWGGANRYFPQKPTYPFLGGKDGMNAWYRGEPVAFAKAVGKSIASAKDSIMTTLAEFAQDPISALKSLAAGVAKLGMVEMGKGRAPSIVAMRSLLTGEPVGEWHMVVGNPYNPIAKIGNLIVTESKFQFNDIVGTDDFPTELKVSITVEHGRPRDKGDIESMFNQGQGRIYYPRKGELDKLNMSSATGNSTNDTSRKGSKGSFSSSWSTIGLFTGTAEEFDKILSIGSAASSDMGTAAKSSYKTANLMFDRWAGREGKPPTTGFNPQDYK